MQEKLIRKIQNIIKKDPRMVIKLTSALHYQSSSTIWNWISRRRVPESKIKAVEKVLAGESK